MSQGRHNSGFDARSSNELRSAVRALVWVAVFFLLVAIGVVWYLTVTFDLNQRTVVSLAAFFTAIPIAIGVRAGALKELSRNLPTEVPLPPTPARASLSEGQRSATVEVPWRGRGVLFNPLRRGRPILGGAPVHLGPATHFRYSPQWRFNVTLDHPHTMDPERLPQWELPREADALELVTVNGEVAARIDVPLGFTEIHVIPHSEISPFSAVIYLKGPSHE